MLLEQTLHRRGSLTACYFFFTSFASFSKRSLSVRSLKLFSINSAKGSISSLLPSSP
jgi:hypothetical protein